MNHIRSRKLQTTSRAAAPLSKLVKPATSLLVITLVVAGFLGCAAAEAPPMLEVTETMMNAAGLDNLLLSVWLGVDQSADLQYTSYVDPINRAFSFSLISGQIYLGKPISLTAAGAYDSGLGQYEWTTLGSYNGNSFVDEGSEAWYDAPGDNEVKVMGGFKDKETGKIYMFSGKGDLNTNDLTSTFKGLEIKDKDGKLVDTGEGTDKLRIFVEKGEIEYGWDITTFKGKKIKTGGAEKGAGGPGVFDVGYESVPEPSSLLLGGSGVLGLCGYLRLRLLRRRVPHTN